MLRKIFEANPVALARQLRDQWNEFLDDYAGRRLSAGPGIRLNRTWGAGTTISATASPGGGGVSNQGGGAAYANYFKVAATGYSDRGVITGVRIFDGGDPESTSAGLTDVGDVPVTTLAGTFQDGTLFFVRLTVPDTPPPSSGTNFYTHTFFTASRSNFPNAWEPVVLLAEVVNGQIVQRWTGGMIYWRSRFIIGFGLEYNL